MHRHPTCWITVPIVAQQNGSARGGSCSTIAASPCSPNAFTIHYTPAVEVTDALAPVIHQTSCHATSSTTRQRPGSLAISFAKQLGQALHLVMGYILRPIISMEYPIKCAKVMDSKQKAPHYTVPLTWVTLAWEIDKMGFSSYPNLFCLAQLSATMSYISRNLGHLIQ
jgi:hypothetical protein